MKCHIHLKSSSFEYSKSIWPEDVCFKEIISTPKVISVLEVCGETKYAALSSHYDYLAVVNGRRGIEETLFILHLKEKRVTPLKSFPHPVTMMHFVPDKEDELFVGSHCGRIFYFGIESGFLKVLEGHSSALCQVALGLKSEMLISWSSSDVLLWSLPQCKQLKRLKIDPNYVVIKCGYVTTKNYIFAAFDSGLILFWDQGQEMREYSMKPPDNLNMTFNSFSVSSDEEWLVGVGSEPLIVIYSLATQKVAQVVHFSHPGALKSIDYVHCLPPIHPQHPKTYLMRTTNCVFVIDLIRSAVIKALKSHRYSISEVCVSADGFLIGVVYGNGTTKLYTLPSFYPKSSSALSVAEDPAEDVKFTVLNLKEQTGKKSNIESLLDESKWTAILEEFGEFPQKYRKHIWVSLSRLPRNFSLFSQILTKTKTHQFPSLQEQFPLLDTSTVEVLKSTLECLCYWAPFLTRVEYVSSFVLPFIQLFEPNALLCFEETAFVILNWWSCWFEDWPSPPTRILSLIDEMVCSADAELWLHLRRMNASPEDYAWPLLTSGFKEVFTRDDWLTVWDHILSKPPSFTLCLCAAFTLCLRGTILKCSQESHLKQLYSQETWTPVRDILRKSKLLYPLKMEEGLRKKMDTKRFLIKDAFLPFDIGPEENSFEKGFSHQFESSAFNKPEARLISTKLGTAPQTVLPRSPFPLDKSGSAKLSFQDTSSAKSDALWNCKELTTLEEKCLSRIQKTRRRMIERT